MADNRDDDSRDDDLAVHRQAIDAIDEQILALMNRRIEEARSIARIKAELDDPAYYRPERESRLLRRLMEINPGPLPDRCVEPLFREIMSITRSTEAAMSVAILGPLGTYSESAARKHFGSQVDIRDFSTMDEIFKVTETGRTDFSVVPVENSTEGGVTGTLDRLVTTTLRICGEINLRIHHNFMSSSGRMEDVQVIYSHTQSLGQCRRWIDRHCPHAERIPVSSNADAARKASQEPHSAAIAGDAAADRYGLAVISAQIEDEPGNTTRFVVLSDRDAPLSGNDKTSIILSSRSQPGSLVRLLNPLLEEGIDMVKIESRPSRVGMWEYIFFIDIVGHRDEPRVARALSQLEQEAALFKNLGSYPVVIHDE